MVFDRINAASLAVQLAVLSHRTLFLSQKRRIVNLDAIALPGAAESVARLNTYKARYDLPGEWKLSNSR